MDKKNRPAFAGAFVLALIAACGGSTSSATRTDITGYQQLALNVLSAADTYGSTMGGPSVADAECPSTHDQYDARVRPWVSALIQKAPEMDAYIEGHGGSSTADVSCGAATVMDELDFHHSIACSLSSLSANKAEAARHADTMNAFVGHLLARCSEMLDQHKERSFTPAMSGCERWSTTCCSALMRTGCCGGLMGLDDMMRGETCCGAGG